MIKINQELEHGYKANLATQVAKLLNCDLKKINELYSHDGDHTPLFSAQDFSIFDHLHSRGRTATQELSEFLTVHPGSKLLDIGCGIGGAARFITERFVCKVHGLDITKNYCETADLLNLLCGLDKRIDITHGDALSLPYDDNSFDTVWTQHTSMNIADKETYYSEIHRVLKTGGQFLFHDIFSNKEQHSEKDNKLLFPLPWAVTEDQNHLPKGEIIRDLLGNLGFIREIWNDVTAETSIWFHNYSDSMQLADGLGPALFIGEDFPQRVKNFKQNLKENKFTVIQAVYSKR